MKRAVILHGTDSAPDKNWFPWMKAQLQAHGYEVWVPQLPDCHTPNRKTYGDFLFTQNWDFSDNLLIGHSSGAVSVLNLLMDKRCPRVATTVLVSAWAHMEGTDLDVERFKNLFPTEGFDFAKIKHNAEHFLYLHGTNDPYCPIDQAFWLREQTGGNFVEVPNGHHLGARYVELPQLVNELKERGWL